MITVISATVDGVIAALVAPFFLALGFFIWDSKWNGSAFALNLYKCNVASIWFIIMAAIRGFAIDGYTEEVFTVTSVGYLTLSSTLGIIIGDILWLEALRLLGAKHVIVADLLKPFAVAVLGRFILDETIHLLGYVGMMMTCVGVAVVALEGHNDIANNSKTNNVHQQSESDMKQPEEGCSEKKIGFNHIEQKQQQEKVTGNTLKAKEGKQKSIQGKLKEFKRGYLCAIFNVIADSFGSLLTKKHGIGMTTWTINLIRFGFAGIILLIISISMRLHRQCFFTEDNCLIEVEDSAIARATYIDENHNSVHEIKESKDSEEGNMLSWFELPTLTTKEWLQITLGVAFVTFLCPALEKFALMQIALGLCAALASVGPLYGVLMDWTFKSRRPKVIGCVGAALAIGGVVLLCTYGI